jgi:hypothetical protein
MLPRLVAALGLAGLAACSQATAGDDRGGVAVLLIGNSLTSANDLPGAVATVAEAAHDTMRVGMAAGANLAVIDHTNGSTDAVGQIDAGGYRFVVLQQGPTPAGVCRDTLVIAAMRLAPHVGAGGGRIALFLPWARQGSPAALAAAAESATLAARAVGGVVVPVGIAWKLALQADPTLPLYGPDGYHPAPAGTLLAALTIYERLAGRDVRDIAPALASRWSPPLGPGVLQLLGASAHAAVERVPQDPPAPAPPDTAVVSLGGGPC